MDSPSSGSAALSPQQVRQQLARLQDSPTFSSSQRLTAFLNFVVDQTLRQADAALKEAVIGNAIYGRKPPYDPRIDSTVRVEARRLRQKLQTYYQGEGQNDPIRIDLPTGGYAPRFTANKAGSDQAMRLDDHDAPDADQGVPVLAIMPFMSLSPGGARDVFLDSLTDELIFVAERIEGLRVTPRIVVFQHRNRPCSLKTLADALGAQAILHGALRWDEAVIRVTLELCDARGFVIWSSRFEVEDKDSQSLLDEIVSTTFDRLRPLDLQAFKALKTEAARSWGLKSKA